MQVGLVAVSENSSEEGVFSLEERGVVLFYLDVQATVAERACVLREGPLS